MGAYCKDCGVLLLRPRAKLCDECRKKHERMRKRKRSDSASMTPPAMYPPVDDEKCRECRYFRGAVEKGKKTSASRFCHYLLDNGHSRGCPPGSGCDKFTPDKETAAETKKRVRPRYGRRD